MTDCQTCGGFGMHHDPIAHGTDDRNRWERHEWTGGDPDWCARCGIDWDDADIKCEEIR